MAIPYLQPVLVSSSAIAETDYAAWMWSKWVSDALECATLTVMWECFATLGIALRPCEPFQTIERHGRQEDVQICRCTE